MHEHIKREKAIEAVCKCCLANGICGHTCKEITALQSIPAADVQPVVRGKWDHLGGGEWRCSQCGYGIMPWNAGQNFCPNCGADMREES